MKIFNVTDYRAFLNGHLEGAAITNRSVATALGIHPSLLLRIRRGDRQLTSDQAFRAALFLKLSDLETDFLLALVQLERASHPTHRRRIQAQLQTIRAEADSAVPGGAARDRLSQANQILFYSSWYYSAIRLMTATPAYTGPDQIGKISARLNLPLSIVEQALDFLLSSGLCARSPEGRIVRTPFDTRLDRNSAMIDRHLMNWRAHACEHLPRSSPEALFHTSPVALSAPVAEKLRQQIRELIQRTQEGPAEEAPERLFCLNIDWFEF